MLILVLLVWWMFSAKQVSAPAGETAVKGGTETVYDQQLNGLDEANITQELQGIDADLQKL